MKGGVNTQLVPNIWVNSGL